MNTNAPVPTAAPAWPFPDDFAFSQSSLQAYEDCPRRFWLAYVQQLPWPALEAAPALEYEQQLRWGSVFHKLVERAETGLHVPAANLPTPLAEWWDAYANHRPRDLDLGRREVEFVLNATLTRSGQSPPDQAEQDATVPGAIYRVAAKYDLIAIVEDGPIIIVDWKTGARRPRPETIQRKWQTALYPFVLVESAANLDWGPIDPERIELRYWFTAEPENPIIFRYSRLRHEETRTRLTATVREIFAGVGERDFPKIPDTEANRLRFCQFCIYRSRCDRGISAGPLDETLNDTLDTSLDENLLANALDFTLDDVGELAF
ncbi:MAG: PD-(D/E)XK nuclease family protein [Litorilinea sp.]